MSTNRRSFLKTVLTASAVAALLPLEVGAEALTLDPIPPLPVTPAPGKPGDFDFLAGNWRIDHFQLKAGASEWDRFEGEATCWSILGGVASVEELRIPARGFSGMGLRMLDVENRVWSDHWVNARSGVLGCPGQLGSFESGAGIFASDYEDQGRTMKSVGVWDRITASSCRWRQATSADGGKTWAQNWVMHWQRT